MLSAQPVHIAQEYTLTNGALGYRIADGHATQHKQIFLIRLLAEKMDDPIGEHMGEHAESQAISKPVSDILTMLRAMANPMDGFHLADFHSHRLMSEKRRIESRSTRATFENVNLAAALQYGCASATVLGVLQMLTGFFE